jgi:peptidoglycan/LPS O-acetylase OafA/YrhL
MKNIKGELSVSIILLILLFAVFNPWQIAMPGYVVMCLLLAVLLLFIGFAVFLWREGRGDERENLHRMVADRIAFLTGSALLVAGIIAEELSRALDPWIIGVLAVMILAKMIGLIYAKIKL